MKRILMLIICAGMLFGCADDEENKKVKTEETSEKAKVYLEKDNCFKYHYDKLSDKKKKVYEEIYMGISKREKKIKVSSSNEDDIYEIATLVSYDHPELYAYSGTSIYNGENKSELIVGYIKDERSAKEIQVLLDQTLAEVYQRIPEGASDYDKVRIVYEYMIERCEYVESSKNNQNILSSLVGNQTVCAGYAKGIQYILNDLGIPCSYIVGEIINPADNENSSHAWDMVELNGSYYYLDATWGDVVEVAPHTCHAYFMMSQAEMLQLYVPEGETLETVAYDNYFIQNETYLSEYNEYMIGQILMQCVNEGRNVMEIKCDPQQLNNLETQLAQNGRIYEIAYANGLNYDNLTYITTPELGMMEIILN